MTPAAWALRHPVLPLVVIGVLALFGLRAALQMPLTDLPDIGENRITVQLRAPGATLGATDADLAQPVEDRLAAMPEIGTIRARVTAGEVRLTLSLRDSRTAQDTLAEVSDRLQALIPALAIEARIGELRAVSSRRRPAVELVVVPRDGDIGAARAAMRDRIRPALRAVAGLADIAVTGAGEPGLSVRPDAARLAAADITLPEFNRQLAAALSRQAAGRVRTTNALGAGDVLLGLAAPGAEASRAALTTLPLRTGTGQAVPLAAVADIVRAPVQGDWIVRHAGAPALLVELYPDPRADLGGLLAALDERLLQIRADHPALQFHVLDRPAERAVRALDATARALLEGCLLVVAVIALALRDRRATALAALALPLSVLPTLYLMQLFGLSLNIVSLLALSLASGILVDDAIVEIENIHKHLRGRATPRRAVARAVREIALPVLATSCAILAVFLPVAAMPGEAGRYFWAFGATLCIATVFSFLVSRLVVPPLAARLLSRCGTRPAGPRHGRLRRCYARLLGGTLALRWLCVGAVLLVAGLSVAALLRHPGTFVPEDPARLMRIDMALPPAAGAGPKAVQIDALTRDLAALAGVDGVTARVPDGPEARPRLLVRTDGTPETAGAVRRVIAAYPDSRAIVLRPSGRPKMALDLAAPDLRTLELALPRLLGALSAVPGAAMPMPAAPGKQPELRLVPDAATMRGFGLGREDIRAVQQAVAHTENAEIARLQRPDGASLPIRVDPVWAETDQGGGGWHFAAVRLPGGALVPLASLGRLDLRMTDRLLERRDGLYVLRLLADPSSAAAGRRIGRAADRAVTALARELPGLTLLPAGDVQQRHAMMADLRTAGGSMVLLLAAVLVLLFRSVGQVAAILVSLTLSVAGGALVLLLSGLPVSLPVMIGLLLLLGIMAKNAILLIDRGQRIFRETGDMAGALVAAALDRARPILMTSVAMVAGMIPAALPWLDGAAFRQPLALTVIGGVVVSTGLSLAVVPALSLVAHDVEGATIRAWRHLVRRCARDRGWWPSRLRRERA